MARVGLAEMSTNRFEVGERKSRHQDRGRGDANDDQAVAWDQAISEGTLQRLANTADQLRGPRRPFAIADLVSCIRLFGVPLFGQRAVTTRVAWRKTLKRYLRSFVLAHRPQLAVQRGE